MNLGLNPLLVKLAWGYTPIVPLHSSSDEAMGRTNDAVQYGDTANYTVIYEAENYVACSIRKRRRHRLK
jgi:methenyltetrahydromethanopterin cyclohydrolase